MNTARTAPGRVRPRAAGLSGIRRPNWFGRNLPWPRWAFVTLGLVLAAAAAGGCMEANTLGDEPPDEVPVGSPPAWSNGMQELMTLKCGVCHQVPRPQSAPEQTPDDYDFTVLHGTAKGEDNEAVGAGDAVGEIQSVVQSGAMPLEFATPLTANERGAILAWDGN